MEIKKIEAIMSKISGLMLEYEEGDLILISDILENITALKVLVTNHVTASALVQFILNFVSKVFKGEPITDIQVGISRGIDLITRIINNAKSGISEDERLLKNDIDEYTRDLMSKVPGLDAAGEEDKRIAAAAKSDTAVSGAHKSDDVDLSADIIKIFLTESNERLSRMQELILNLEDDLYNKSIINELFRIFHTIKGECGFLKLGTLGEYTHNLENLLDMIRSDEVENTAVIIDLLLESVDFIIEIMAIIRQEDIEAYNNIVIEPYLERINGITSDARPPIGRILEDNQQLTHDDVSEIIEEQKETGFQKKFGEIAVEKQKITEEEIETTLEHQKEIKKQVEKKQVDHMIKVKASQINYLVDMVGELIIAENQLESSANISQIKKITREIQNAAMVLRTVKIRSLFINMKRVVRDVAKKLDKEVLMELVGEELEIDRNLVESLEEPLIHILRNAVGHGIESPKERIEKGKSEIGKIILKAERLGHNILISIRDDGKGLNKEKILQKALEKKLVDEESVKILSDYEIYNFIYHPGFSTVTDVNNVSGRGVGMDVVKAIVSNLRGRIEIASEIGKFTQIDLFFPLSMAIIDGMIVRSCDTFFILPVSNIIESLSIEDNMLYKVKNQESVIKLRQEIIPVITLSKFFNLTAAEGVVETREMAVIVEYGKRKYAFLVDEVVAKREIVIKSLGDKFQLLRGISSGTVLSEGKIGFVLNIDQVVSTTRYTAHTEALGEAMQ